MEDTDIKKAGLKVTLPRVKILQILESCEQGHQHMSAEDVYRALLAAGEDVGLATVYRVLTQFESAGLVTRHHFETGHSVFELAKGEHHDHMVDVDTGKVIEFVNERIESLLNGGKKVVFDLEHHLSTQAGPRAYFDQASPVEHLACIDQEVDQGLLELRLVGLDAGQQGLQVGDELLVQLSQRLQAKLREEDTAARLGGDEFVLVVPSDRIAFLTSLCQDIIDKVFLGQMEPLYTMVPKGMK